MKSKTLDGIELWFIFLGLLLLITLGWAFLISPDGYVEPTELGAVQLSSCQQKYCVEKGLQPSTKNNVDPIGWRTNIYCLDGREEKKFLFGNEIYRICNVELRVTITGKILKLIGLSKNVYQ